MQALVGIVLSGIVVAGQAPPSRDRPHRFDVVSVKLNPSLTQGAAFAAAPRRLTLIAYPLRDLVLLAFRLGRYDLVMPSAIPKGHFDISAIADTDLTTPEKFEMLQSVLVERFGMEFHHERRPMPVYVLRREHPDALGEDLKPVSLNCQVIPTPCHPLVKRGSLSGDAPWPAVLSLINTGVDRRIVDETQLAGTFTVHIEFGIAAGADDPAQAVSVFTAVREHLGLVLEPATRPVEVLVVDEIHDPMAD